MINESIIIEEQFEFEHAYKDITLLKPFFQDICNIDFDTHSYHLLISDNSNVQIAIKLNCEQNNLRRIISLIVGEPKLLQEIQDSLATCFSEFSILPNTFQSELANSNAPIMFLLEIYKKSPHTYRDKS